jgi:chemotaxis protein CheZ
MSEIKDAIDQNRMDNILEQTEALKNYLEKEGEGSIEQLILFMDTLKEAIISITTGDLQKAAESMKQLTVIASSELFRGIGGITRELHESIKEIKDFLEPLLTNISEQDIQGLSSKLAHVSNLVKDTSERTLDLLFSRQEIALSDNVAYDRIARLIVSDDKKGALLKLKELKTHNSELVNELMRLSELQIHADLVDQIIKKVSKVMDNMEMRLVDLIRRYGHHAGLKDFDSKQGDGSTLYGPAIPRDDKGIASSQDDVDSLLKSLGL